jgi:hypothetical protein
MVNCADESTGATTKSLCNKLLMGTVKQDIPAVRHHMNYLVFHFTDQVTLSKILVYQALDRLKKNQMEEVYYRGILL